MLTSLVSQDIADACHLRQAQVNVSGVTSDNVQVTIYASENQSAAFDRELKSMCSALQTRRLALIRMTNLSGADLNVTDCTVANVETTRNFENQSEAGQLDLAFAVSGKDVNFVRHDEEIKAAVKADVARALNVMEDDLIVLRHEPVSALNRLCSVSVYLRQRSTTAADRSAL